MNRPLISRRFDLLLLCVFGACLLSPSPVSLATEAPAPNPCALLDASYVKPLLGNKPVAQNEGGSCTWTATTSSKKLVVITYKKVVGAPSDIGFMSALRSALKRGRVINEPGLGDQAFANLESSGVSMVILKRSRLLQLQYQTGNAGTTKDVDALRPLAKKAVASY